MFASMFAHQIDGVLEFERRLVDARGGERIERVGDGRNAPFDWDRLSLQLAGVSAAIPPFMMGQGYGGCS